MPAITSKILTPSLCRTAAAWDGTILAFQPVPDSLFTAILSASHLERIGMICLIAFTVVETFHLLKHLWHWTANRYRAWQRTKRGRKASLEVSPTNAGSSAAPSMDLLPTRPTKSKSRSSSKASREVAATKAQRQPGSKSARGRTVKVRPRRES